MKGWRRAVISRSWLVSGSCVTTAVSSPGNHFSWGDFCLEVLHFLLYNTRDASSVICPVSQSSDKTTCHCILEIWIKQGRSWETSDGGWRDSQAVSNTGRSCRGLELGSQHPHGGSQPSLTPLQGTWCPFLASAGTSHTWYRNIHPGKTPMSMK